MLLSGHNPAVTSQRKGLLKIPGLMDKTSLSVLHRLGKLISFNFLLWDFLYRAIDIMPFNESNVDIIDLDVRTINNL